jgi:hypothetical protein
VTSGNVQELPYLGADDDVGNNNGGGGTSAAALARTERGILDQLRAYLSSQRKTVRQLKKRLVRARTHTLLCAHIHTCMRARAHTHTHTLTHTHTHTRTHTHQLRAQEAWKAKKADFDDEFRHAGDKSKRNAFASLRREKVSLDDDARALNEDVQSLRDIQLWTEVRGTSVGM